MESNKNQASDCVMKQRSRKTQIHKMHPVFIEFYHFPLETIFFTNNTNKKFLKTFKQYFFKKISSFFSD